MKIKYATIDGLLCIEHTKFIKGQTRKNAKIPRQCKYKRKNAKIPRQCKFKRKNANIKEKTLKSHDNANLKGKTQI